MTPEAWHLIYDTWHLTLSGGGEHSLNLSSPHLLWFGIDSFLKILKKRVTDWMNQSMNHKGDYGTTSATPGPFFLSGACSSFVSRFTQLSLWNIYIKSVNCIACLGIQRKILLVYIPCCFQNYFLSLHRLLRNWACCTWIS